MPCVEIYQNKKTADVVLCSFVHCKELGGGSTPTGKLLTIPANRFSEDCFSIIEKEFELFYTRDYEIRSELYDEMTKAEQKKFLSEHTKAIVSWPIKHEPVNIYIGPSNDFYVKVAFPSDQATFTGAILAALAKAACSQR